MWAKLSLALANLFSKLVPALIALFAYIQGKAAQRNETEKANLEKQKEYAEIRADKRGRLDDDLDRMQDGTY